VALFPQQDTFVRGELSPRLHARASLDLYRAGLARCFNFLTLPHGGIRKRGGTYFVAEVKDSADEARLIPFVFSAEQAYCLELGDLYLRVYAYGARVGTVEVVTPWPATALRDIQFYQSADQMWLAHPSYPLQILTRVAHTTWTIEEYDLEDGPFEEINISGTKLTPADYGSSVPDMSNNTTPSGTASSNTGSANAWRVFDKNDATAYSVGDREGILTYDFPGATTKTVNAYAIRCESVGIPEPPSVWKFEGFDGVDWVTLDSRTGEVGWNGGEKRFYEFTNKTPYQSYRLNWTDIDGTDGETDISELSLNQDGDEQTPFNLTASSIVGINNDTGFQTTDVGRLLRLQGSDGNWRWARIAARTSTTVVTIRLYGHALPDLSPIINWRLGALTGTEHAAAVAIYEERLALARRFSVYLSESFDLNSFSPGEEDDDGMEFVNAGGGQANDIVWIADGDGYLLLATTGGVRALSGSGVDEALTPSSFKNRRSRTHGAARIQPVDAGSSFLYVTRSRRSIAELSMNQYGRFSSEDIGQVSEHIPKVGVVEIAYQENPDPILWFPLDNGELGGFTHQPAQEVRGMHRHLPGRTLDEYDVPVVETICVTPGADGLNDDVWMVVWRTTGGGTQRYIELLTAPSEGEALASVDIGTATKKYGLETPQGVAAGLDENSTLMQSFAVDSGLTYEGAATNTLTGLTHLADETVDVLADGIVYKGLTVSAGGVVTLPDGVTCTKAHAGLAFTAEADTLELDVGGKDGSLSGRRKKVQAVILSLYETDTTGLEIRSLLRGAWESVNIPSVAPQSDTITLFTGNVKVPIDDSWEGMGKVQIRHTNPTPCTIRAMTPVFDSEP
jgi:hypothetical protein